MGSSCLIGIELQLGYEKVLKMNGGDAYTTV